MGTEYVILATASVLTIYNLVNYLGVRQLTQWLLVRYKNEAGELELQKERALIEIMVKRQTKPFDLTILVSNLEFILIAGTTLLVLNNSEGGLSYNNLSKIGLVALAWLAIKTLGYRNQWQLPIFGASLFLVFLLVAIINILAGFGGGLLLDGLF